jgi:putative ABC transport system substrate-binding protein
VIDRRTFLAGTGAVLLAAPLAAEGQQATPAHAQQVGWFALVPLPRLLSEFQSGMRELGYVEGATYTLLPRYAEAKVDRLPGLAAELIRLKPDVIVSEAFGPTQALQRVTKTIPIVFITGDPVERGFVRSLARPGGNLTGVANLTLELFPKRIEVLKEAVPKLRRLAIFVGAAIRLDLLTRNAQETARSQGIEVLPVFNMNRAEDLDAAFAQAARARADAILMYPSPFFNAHRDLLLTLAARHRLPALYEFRDFVEAGGFMCYGTDNREVYRRVATYVDKILKGAKPGDLPVEQPTKFELVINLKTAKALGLTIPQSLLLRADHVIE